MESELAIAAWLATSFIARMNNLLSCPTLQMKSAEAKLKKLQQVLENIRAISCLDRMKQISRQSFKDWVWRFKDAFYLAEDAIDGIESQASRRSSKSTKRASSSSSSTSSSSQKRETSTIVKALHAVLPGFEQDDIKQLVEVMKTFEELSNDISNLLKMADQLEAVGGKQMAEIPTWRPKSTPSIFRSIRGRDDEKKLLLKALRDESTDDSGSNLCNLSPVSVVGSAGIGKTELARLAYNDTEVGDLFDRKVWICISNNPDLKNLMIEMIDSAAGERPKHLNKIISLEKIRGILAEKLRNERFLLVLDDVWEDFIALWADLSTLFNLGNKGSRVIVTTRLEKVATGIESKEILHLDGLRRKDLSELLKDCASGKKQHTGNSDLEYIGREIEDNFGGSPLAAVAIGYKLKFDLTKEHWKRISRKKHGVIDPRDQDIVSVLEFSYQHLPPQLKLCFLACALFPKNHCFKKDELLQIWTALGFASRTDELDNHEDLVEGLSSRSFFVNSEKKKNKFVIHAVLHELADIISDGEFFRLEGELKETAIPEKARHVYVTADNLIKFSDSWSEKGNLVSLVIAGALSPRVSQPDFTRSLEQVLKNSERLRLLMISALPGELPKAIGDLKHLRYLEFPVPDGEVKMLPASYATLHHLQRLNPKARSKNWEFPKGVNLPPKLLYQQRLEG